MARIMTRMFSFKRTKMLQNVDCSLHRMDLDSYSMDLVEGNDEVPEYDKDPYFAVNLGKLTDRDYPRQALQNSAGFFGDIAESRSHFREFVRAQIGSRWYLVSNHALWRYHMRLRKVDELILNQDKNSDGDKNDILWIDDQSVTDGTNAGF